MMTPEERISKLVNSWAGQTYLLCHDDLVNLIREVERDTWAKVRKEVEMLQEESPFCQEMKEK